MVIKKSADQNISIGYIKPGVSYVIKNQGSYWEIKKHIPEYANKLSSLVNPQRTCRTVKLQNNIARMWSGTSSRCINKCPGFDYDDRIGAGATLHRGFGGFKKVRWPESNLNSYVILKINANSSGPNNTFNEYTGDLSPGNFTGTEPYFVVARYCNNDGSWGDPIYLCQVSGGSSSDRPSAPANSLDEFITANSYNSSFGNSIKYISANRTDKAESDCLNGFYKDLNSGIVYNPSNTKSSSEYICTYDSSQINAKFERVLGTERRCIKYCTAESVVDFNKYDLQRSTLYKSSSGNFNVACNS
jgi:hypothetical protein